MFHLTFQLVGKFLVQHKMERDKSHGSKQSSQLMAINNNKHSTVI